LNVLDLLRVHLGIEQEDEMAAAKETAEATSQAKSEFLNKIDYEIRTAMNGIVGMTDHRPSAEDSAR